jgi:FkbM family methyltransferase
MHRRGVFAYTTRCDGVRVAIRHGTGDVVTLGEIFHDRQYAPPPELAGVLDDVRNILDLGANIGLFGAFAARRWPDAGIVAFEPDAANATVHEKTIALNGLGHRWKLIRAAAGARDGHAAFRAGHAALSHLVDERADDPSDEASSEVRIEDVLPRVADADLVKMDIEGGEWAILRDPRFRTDRPRAVVLEYHPRFCPEDDPHVAASSALAVAGFGVHPLWGRPDGHGMLWAWRR